eukprot:jgi/Bigna1/66119/fgenesh1_pg.1_\
MSNLPLTKASLEAVRDCIRDCRCAPTWNRCFKSHCDKRTEDGFSRDNEESRMAEICLCFEHHGFPRDSFNFNQNTPNISNFKHLCSSCLPNPNTGATQKLIDLSMPICEIDAAQPPRVYAGARARDRDGFDGEKWLSCSKCLRFVHVNCDKAVNGHDLAEREHSIIKSKTSGETISSYLCLDCTAHKEQKMNVEEDHTNENKDFFTFSSLMLQAAARQEEAQCDAAVNLASLSQKQKIVDKKKQQPASSSISPRKCAPQHQVKLQEAVNVNKQTKDHTLKSKQPVSVKLAPLTVGLSIRSTSRSHDCGGNGATQNGTSGTSAKESRWVRCSLPSCRKWRRLGNKTPLDKLSYPWQCKYNRWDPQYSSCSSAEEALLYDETVLLTHENTQQYAAEKKRFYASLSSFNRQIGRHISRNPTLGGKDLDLYRLYKEVSVRGGFERVVAVEGTWARIFRTLDNFSSTVTDASYRLRRYYQEFLFAYEQHYFFGKEIPEILSSIVLPPMRRRMRRGYAKNTPAMKRSRVSKDFTGITASRAQTPIKGLNAAAAAAAAAAATVVPDAAAVKGTPPKKLKQQMKQSISGVFGRCPKFPRQRKRPRAFVNSSVKLVDNREYKLYHSKRKIRRTPSPISDFEEYRNGSGSPTHCSTQNENSSLPSSLWERFAASGEPISPSTASPLN